MNRTGALVDSMVVGEAIVSIRDRSKGCCFWYRIQFVTDDDAFGGSGCLDVESTWHAQNAQLESDLGGGEENLLFLISVKDSDRHKLWMLSSVIESGRGH